MVKTTYNNSWPFVLGKCYLSSWYWKVKQRHGGKKAIIALSRKLLVIIYNMIKNSTEYSEEKFEIVRQKQSEHHKNRIILEAKKLGLIIVQPETDISA